MEGSFWAFNTLSTLVELASKMSDTSVKAETAPPPRLDALPAELLVRVLKNLEPEALSSCHGLNKLIHGPPSIVEQALRDIASDQGLSVPETLPSGCADWTQALLFLAVLRREGGRSRLAVTCAHSAIIDPSGTLFICGYDCAAPAPALLGRGNPKDLNQSIPRPMPGLENVRVRAAAAACRSIIALSVEGTLFSWGDGSDCVLGHGDRNHVAQPREITGLRNASSISASINRALAITTDGALWSWGEDYLLQGYLGHGLEGVVDLGRHGLEGVVELLPRRIEALAGKYMCAVAAGSCHSLAVCAREGQCFTWGGGEARPVLPVQIRELVGERVSSVAASGYTSCAATLKGELWRWGDWNELKLSPAPLKNTQLDKHRIVSVALGRIVARCYVITAEVPGTGARCYVITAEGALFSWLTDHYQMSITKRNNNDILGRPDTAGSDPYTPQRVTALAGQRVRSIATCAMHSIAAGWIQIASDACNQSRFMYRPGELYAHEAAGCNEAEADQPQWACWSWGAGDSLLVNFTNATNACLGRGEYEKSRATPHPALVMGLGTRVAEECPQCTGPGC